MSEVVQINAEVTAEDVEKIIHLGRRLAANKRTVKEVDGPFMRRDEVVFVVYTEDAP